MKNFVYALTFIIIITLLNIYIVNNYITPKIIFEETQVNYLLLTDEDTETKNPPPCKIEQAMKKPLFKTEIKKAFVIEINEESPIDHLDEEDVECAITERLNAKVRSEISTKN